VLSFLGDEKAAFRFLEGEAHDFDDLVARHRAADDAHVGSPHVERLREKLYHRRIRASPFGGGRDAELPAVTVAADDGRLPRAR